MLPKMEKRRRWGGGEKSKESGGHVSDEGFRRSGWVGVGLLHVWQYTEGPCCKHEGRRFVVVVVFISTAKADSVEEPASNSAPRWYSWLHINRMQETQTQNKCGSGNQSRVQFHKSTEIKGEGDGGSGYTSAPGQKEGAQRVIEETRQHGRRSPEVRNAVGSVRFPF